jgi:ATP synthase protein I
MRIKGASPRQQAYRVVTMQMLTAIIIAALCLFEGWMSSVSAILGGFAAVLPSLFFAYCFFAATFARQVERIIKVFYWGEVIKLLSSALLVIVIPKIWPQVELSAFFIGFAATYLAIGWIPLIEKRRS